MSSKGLRRRIHFYSTQVWELHPDKDDQMVPPSRLLKHLDAVVSKKDWQRTLSDETRSQGILCRMLRDQSLQGQFWIDKHDDFPLMGDGQASMPLETHGHPLRFPSHFCWWDLSKFPEVSGAPKNAEGLLVVEQSQQGPKRSALEEFLNSKSAGKFRVVIDPIVSSQALERLQNTKLIKRVRVRTEDADAIRAMEHDGKMAGLFVLGGLSGIQELEWSVKANGSNRLHVLRNLVSLLKRGKEQPTSPVNIWIGFEDMEMPLEEAAIQHVSKSIRRSSPNSKSVDSNAMWEEIRNAFEAKRPELGRFFGRDLTKPEKAETHALTQGK